MKQIIDEFLELELLSGIANPNEFYHQVAAQIHRLNFQILKAEKKGYERSQIITTLEPIRAIYQKSPFFWRIQSWPRGYPGDFETIEYVCEGINKSSQNTLAYFLEKWTLNCSAVQQHRNKVKYQAFQILETLLNREKPRIFLIACGGCPDLSLIQRYFENMEIGEIVLNDIDDKALEFSQARLKTGKVKFRWEPGNIVRVIKKLDNEEKFDLIIAGGLFDYLSNKTIASLTKKACNLLKNGGKFVATNIAVGNPHRPWMEYIGDWVLIERHETDFLRIFHEVGLDKAKVEIKREETGLTLIIEITTQ